jgi:hypothetical protein
MLVVPEEEQEEFESRRLWAGVTAGIKQKNLDMATDFKNQIEETQRANLRYRQAEGVEWHPRFFQEGRGNESFIFRHLKTYVLLGYANHFAALIGRIQQRLSNRSEI